MTHVVRTFQILQHILFFQEQMTSLTSLPARAEFDTRQMDNILCTGILFTVTHGFKRFQKNKLNDSPLNPFLPLEEFMSLVFEFIFKQENISQERNDNIEKPMALQPALGMGMGRD